MTSNHRTHGSGPRPWSFLTVLLLALVIAAVAFWVAREIGRSGAGAPRTVTPRGDLGAEEATRIAIFERTAPSVVGVTTSRRAARRRGRNIDVPQGSGTGFVWDEAGHIVTNYHVTGDGRDSSRQFGVLLQNASDPIEAEWVGGAENYDLAVLRVPTRDLPPIAVGTSHDLRVGQSVLAIGNPFGLQHTMSAGIISALHRMIEAGLDSQTRQKRYIEDVLQTDAAINPGNSGGPLLDSAGRLIGVNTAIYSETGQNAGIGFAIPVDTVNWVVPELIRHGRIVRPTLGVQFLPGLFLPTEGVQIQSVVKGGPAEQAGLRGTIFENDVLIRREGDILVQIGNRAIRRPTDIITALEPYSVGSRVKVRFVRDGEEREVTVTLAAPSNP